MQAEKKNIVIALKKARTSIDKIIARIEDGGEGSQCFDVMQQTLSAIGLLKNANHHMLEQHLTEYVKGFEGKKTSKRELEKMQNEIIKIVQTAQRK